MVEVLVFQPEYTHYIGVATCPYCRHEIRIEKGRTTNIVVCPKCCRHYRIEFEAARMNRTLPEGKFNFVCVS